MRKKYVLIIITACVILALLAVVLWWAPPSPSGLGVAFLGYTNGTHAVFRVTNSSSAALQFAPNCLLMSEQWRPLGSLPLGESSGTRLPPHSSATVAIARPAGTNPWRVQFYAEPAGLPRRWHLLRMAAQKVGLPVRNPGMPSLGGPSEIIEP